MSKIPTDTAFTPATVAALAGRASGLEPARVEALLSFEGRDHYLGFVAAWKAALASSVTEVREAKRARALKGEGNHDARALACSRREALRAHARGLFALRSAGKAHARRSRRPVRDAA